MKDEKAENTVSAISNGVDGSETSAPRILYLITKANWGGAQRYVFDMATAAKTAGYEVAVAFGTGGLLVKKLMEADIRTIALPDVERDVAMFGTGTNVPHTRTIISSIKRELAVLRHLVKLFKEEKPDIVHVNSSKMGGVGALAGRIAGVPRIIFTAHGWAFNEVRPWWHYLTFRFLYMLTLWLSHKTICVSDAICRDMSFVPFASMKVIRHGMESPAFIQRSKARDKLLPEHKDGFWIGMVSELHPVKRVEDAVDAFVELNGLRPDSILVVCGEGERKEDLMARIRHYGLEKRVFLVGFVEEASRYLKAFDLFLMPSRSEALGLALIEAGYAGLPSIASRVGGMPEIVRHKETGLLIPPENPHALSRAIRTLIEHPEQAQRYGKKLRETTEERFSKGRMIHDTFAVYHGC